VVSSSSGPGGFDQPPPKQRSRWLWWVVLGFGSASFIGFLIVAWKVRTPKFVRAAVVAFVGCGAGVASYAIWPPTVVPGPNASSEVSDEVITSANSLWIVGSIWIGLIAYGLYLDGDFKKFLRAQDDANNLHWHETRAQARNSYKPGAGGFSTASPYGAPAPAPAPTPPPQPPVRSVDHLIAEADQYLTTQPHGNLPGPMPPNVPVT
jgi:hypothetical protein